jgi:spore coat-associated protein N
MKKVKSLKLAMIATAFVGALVVVLGSGGSFSWFTGETSATVRL